MNTPLAQDGTAEHDPECTGCLHDCPWRSHPMGAPYCQICDDHHEASDNENEDEIKKRKSFVAFYCGRHHDYTVDCRRCTIAVKELAKKEKITNE